MARLLVTHPTGEQMIVTVEASGSYFDPSAVLWDERERGPLPNDIELGKMQLIGGSLVKADTASAQHSAAIKARTFPLEIPMAAAREALIDAGLFDVVDGHIATMDQKWHEWWNHADKIHRQFELVETVRVALGWTSEQIDNLFIAAEQIRKQRAGEV